MYHTYVEVVFESAALSVVEDFDFEEMTPPATPPTTAATTITSNSPSKIKKLLLFNPIIFRSSFGSGGSGASGDFCACDG